MVGFDGDKSTFLGEGLEDGEKGGDLLGWVDPCGVVKRGLGAEIDQVGAFGAEATSAG